MDALLPWALDVALGAIGLEVLVLLAWARARRTEMRPADVVGQLLAGGLLLGALRNEVAGGETRWTLALLAASLPAHLWDLRRRARGAGELSPRPAPPSSGSGPAAEPGR